LYDAEIQEFELLLLDVNESVTHYGGTGVNA
jgi:hypothetical protein